MEEKFGKSFPGKMLASSTERKTAPVSKDPVETIGLLMSSMSIYSIQGKKAEGVSRGTTTSSDFSEQKDKSVSDGHKSRSMNRSIFDEQKNRTVARSICDEQGNGTMTRSICAEQKNKTMNRSVYYEQNNARTDSQQIHSESKTNSKSSSTALQHIDESQKLNISKPITDQNVPDKKAILAIGNILRENEKKLREVQMQSSAKIRLNTPQKTAKKLMTDSLPIEKPFSGAKVPVLKSLDPEKGIGISVDAKEVCGVDRAGQGRDGGDRTEIKMCYLSYDDSQAKSPEINERDKNVASYERSSDTVGIYPALCDIMPRGVDSQQQKHPNFSVSPSLAVREQRTLAVKGHHNISDRSGMQTLSVNASGSRAQSYPAFDLNADNVFSHIYLQNFQAGTNSSHLTQNLDKSRLGNSSYDKFSGSHKAFQSTSSSGFPMEYQSICPGYDGESELSNSHSVEVLGPIDSYRSLGYTGSQSVQVEAKTDLKQLECSPTQLKQGYCHVQGGTCKKSVVTKKFENSQEGLQYYSHIKSSTPMLPTDIDQSKFAKAQQQLHNSKMSNPYTKYENFDQRSSFPESLGIGPCAQNERESRIDVHQPSNVVCFNQRSSVPELHISGPHTHTERENRIAVDQTSNIVGLFNGQPVAFQRKSPKTDLLKEESIQDKKQCVKKSEFGPDSSVKLGSFDCQDNVNSEGKNANAADYGSLLFSETQIKKIAQKQLPKYKHSSLKYLNDMLDKPNSYPVIAKPTSSSQHGNNSFTGSQTVKKKKQNPSNETVVFSNIPYDIKEVYFNFNEPISVSDTVPPSHRHCKSKVLPLKKKQTADRQANRKCNKKCPKSKGLTVSNSKEHAILIEEKTSHLPATSVPQSQIQKPACSSQLYGSNEDQTRSFEPQCSQPCLTPFYGSYEDPTRLIPSSCPQLQYNQHTSCISTASQQLSSVPPCLKSLLPTSSSSHPHADSTNINSVIQPSSLPNHLLIEKSKMEVVYDNICHERASIKECSCNTNCNLRMKVLQHNHNQQQQQVQFFNHQLEQHLQEQLEVTHQHLHQEQHFLHPCADTGNLNDIHGSSGYDQLLNFLQVSEWHLQTAAETVLEEMTGKENKVFLADAQSVISSLKSKNQLTQRHNSSKQDLIPLHRHVLYPGTESAHQTQDHVPECSTESSLQETQILPTTVSGYSCNDRDEACPEQSLGQQLNMQSQTLRLMCSSISDMSEPTTNAYERREQSQYHNGLLKQEALSAFYSAKQSVQEENLTNPIDSPVIEHKVLDFKDYLES